VSGETVSNKSFVSFPMAILENWGSGINWFNYANAYLIYRAHTFPFCLYTDSFQISWKICFILQKFSSGTFCSLNFHILGRHEEHFPIFCSFMEHHWYTYFYEHCVISVTDHSTTTIANKKKQITRNLSAEYWKW
jgi:hypothetical protein